ncbi:DUF1949 domain-containing protein, partial [Pseudomonas aeruginosa]
EMSRGLGDVYKRQAEDYGADGVVLTLELPVARFEALQALLVDLSRGQVRPQRLDA